MVTRFQGRNSLFLLAIWLIPLLMVTGTSACLPDPQIHVPDFAPATTSDGGMVIKMDAPSGDLGPAHFSPYGTISGAPVLRAAWVADPGISEAFVVGHSGVILHRLGEGAWQTETSNTTANLYAIAARGAVEIYAVGAEGVILRRAGGVWQREGKELGISASFFGVTTLPGGEVVAVGDLGVVARRQPAGVWTLETGGDLTGTTALRAVFGSALEGLYAVGLGGVILRRTGGTWMHDPLPRDPGGNGNYYAITGSMDGAEVHIAGEYGLLLHRAPDGSRWLVQTLVPPMGMTAPLHLYALYLQGSDLLVAGAGGTVAHRSGAAGSFVIEPTGTGNDLFGMAGAGLRSLLVVGAQGTALRRL